MKTLRQLLYLIIFSAFGLIVHSCISDEISTSPSDVLAFSTDTVSFDTVFTDVGTQTARLWVYNRGKKGLIISDIRFEDPDTRFAMNVDGTSGETFSDIEIRANDSILVFIECLPPESPSSEPALISDNILFLTNGVTQKVVVEAYGQNVTRLKDFTLMEDMTMTAEQPYVVFGEMKVAEGAKLSIEPGARVLFHDKASLTVEGTLEAVGKPGRMIDFRPDRLGDVLPGVAYEILAGQWEGVRIAEKSFGNRLEYVNMRSTVSGLQVDSCADLSRTKLTMVNSWLHNSQGAAFSSKYSKVDAYGCVFSEAAEAVVRLTGGEHTFVQCTLANYYLYSAIREPLLSLYHLFPADLEECSEPLMKASFDNCIIYGLASDINEGDLADSEVYLRYTSLKSAGTDDEHFISCLWDCDPLFYTERSDYYFNYRLKPDSPCIGKGNPAYVSSICMYDMDGLDRLAAGAPDLGAYVFIPPKEGEE